MPTPVSMKCAGSFVCVTRLTVSNISTLIQTMINWQRAARTGGLSQGTQPGLERRPWLGVTHLRAEVEADFNGVMRASAPPTISRALLGLPMGALPCLGRDSPAISVLAGPDASCASALFHAGLYQCHCTVPVATGRFSGIQVPVPSRHMHRVSLLCKRPLFDSSLGARLPVVQPVATHEQLTGQAAALAFEPARIQGAAAATRAIARYPRCEAWCAFCDGMLPEWLLSVLSPSSLSVMGFKSAVGRLQGLFGAHCPCAA